MVTLFDPRSAIDELTRMRILRRMADDPNELFSKIFFRLLNADSDVRSMRRIAETGGTIAEGQIPDMSRLWVDQLLADAANDAIFIDKEKCLPERGGAQGLANGMAQQELEAFRARLTPPQSSSCTPASTLPHTTSAE